MKQIYVLIIEDSIFWADLNIRELKKAGFMVQYQMASNRRDMEKALRDRHWDVILCDNNMPAFDAKQALELRNRLSSLTPFVIVSEDIPDDHVNDALSQGCSSYIPKEHVYKLGQCVAELLTKTQG